MNVTFPFNHTASLYIEIDPSNCHAHPNNAPVSWKTMHLSAGKPLQFEANKYLYKEIPTEHLKNTICQMNTL